MHSTQELSEDNLSNPAHSNQMLDMEVEKNFSVSVQKKRKKLSELLESKRSLEILITPHRKAFKGDNVDNFRGSKFRGISKN